MEDKALEENKAPKENKVAEDKTIDPSPKELALTKVLNELQQEYEKLKQELKQVKISNEELSIKIGIDKPKTDLLKNYSKYTRSEN